MGEIERGNGRLADIGVDMSGQGPEPGFDRIHAFSNHREIAALDDLLDQAELFRRKACIFVPYGDGGGDKGLTHIVRAQFLQRFVGIGKTNLRSVDVQGARALVTVEFASEIISLTRAKDGSVVDGDDKAIRAVDDIWTFERDVTSADPNWKLTATQSPA